MNWKAAFIWLLIITVIAGFAGYCYHEDSIERVSQKAYTSGRQDGWELAELVKIGLEDPKKMFDLGYSKGYYDGLKDTDAYWAGHEAGRDEGYAEGYDDGKEGRPYFR